MMQLKWGCRVGVGVLLGVVCASTALAAGPDEQWSMTATMSMTQPMAMSMPAITSKVCRAADEDLGPPPMKNNDCKVKHWDRSGSKVSYEVSCTQHGMSMDGKGWTQKTDASHMQGHMSMSGTTSGTAMAMTVDYSGERIGSCTATKTAKGE
ncbi:MAG: DUF3617 domain-containing protein [Xanthomonadales bacterium]|nr:DUF3617 domain-containing protein [Xanthomonadales bacterium]